MADDDLLEFLPLFPDDDEAAILARMRAWANEGLDPAVDTDAWVDTQEGSHWHISVMPTVREIARLYDLAGTEVPASAFPVWSWGDYLDDHAEVQDIVRLVATPATGVVTFAGAPATPIAAGTVVGVEPIGPDDPAPEFEVTVGGVIGAGGTVDLAIRATEAGAASVVPAEAITVVVSPPSLASAVTVINAAATEGGTDPESDTGLRERVLAAFAGQGAGNRRDYERWARAWAGVGRATVIPLWNGPGTVKVIVTTAAGEPVAADVVAGLQADLDPTAGRADGRAPVGATVTVTTATALPVTPGATIEFETGFSLDGAAGTIALRGDITDALRDYVERVEPGSEVVLAQVQARIALVGGVHDVGAVTINGVAANLPVDDDPAQAPQLQDPVLVEGVL